MQAISSTCKLLVLLISFGMFFRCTAPAETNKPFNVQEMEAFMANYAELLRVRNMEGIANLYADSAIVMSGHGRSETLSFDSVKSYYMRSSRELVDFRWDKIRVEPLGENLFWLQRFSIGTETARLRTQEFL
jgi:ketosteroid isomerase-like protein